MHAAEYLAFLVGEIHSTVVATVDEAGLPVTCVIDMMHSDENGLYFLTARGKPFYRRLSDQGILALSGFKGADTMHCAAISLRGSVRECGDALLPLLFAKNPYMHTIYPTAESRRTLTVFQIYEGSGEWFDLSKSPIERDSFTFGGAEAHREGYAVTDACIGCGTCLPVCPQRCIAMENGRAAIAQAHCLHCGSCADVCPVSAVVRL